MAATHLSDCGKEKLKNWHVLPALRWTQDELSFGQAGIQNASSLRGGEADVAIQKASFRYPLLDCHGPAGLAMTSLLISALQLHTAMHQSFGCEQCAPGINTKSGNAVIAGKHSRHDNPDTSSLREGIADAAIQNAPFRYPLLDCHGPAGLAMTSRVKHQGTNSYNACIQIIPFWIQRLYQLQFFRP